MSTAAVAQPNVALPISPPNSGANGGAGPAKATFKHNLPPSFSPGYFEAIERFLQVDCPGFNTEHTAVNNDLLRCAQIAAVGFSEETNLGPASPTLCTGKPLHAPARDQYNGPLQAFLQHPLSSFSKPSNWQSWVKLRDRMLDDFSTHARRCLKGEVKMMELPSDHLKTEGSGAGMTKSRSFHGGNLNGSGELGRSSSFSPSSPQRSGSFARLPSDSPLARSGRPGAAVVPDSNSNEVLLKVGLNSYFDPERLVMLHVWDNPRCARAFVQQWQRIAQAIFECRVELIHSPISVVNVVDGTFVSVTALPPLVDAGKWPPLTGVGMPSLGSQTLVDHAAEQLIRYLGNDATDRPLKEGLTLHPGADGRYYLMQPPAALFPTFQKDTVPTPLILPRHELLLTQLVDNKTHLPFFEVCENSIIPAVIKSLVAQVAKARGTDAPLTPDLIVRENRLGFTMHEHGANLCFLGMLHQQLGRCVSENEAADAIVQLLRTAVATEMVARTLQHLIRLDLHGGAAGGRDRDLGKYAGNERQRLDVINRLARLVVGRKEEFLQQVVLPILQRKYMCPEFVATWADVHPGTCLKLISARTGAEFGGPEGRFFRFVQSATKDLVLVACNTTLEGYLCDDLPLAEKGTRAMWAQADAAPVDSVLHEALLLRAAAASIISGLVKGKVPMSRILGKANSEEFHPLLQLQLLSNCLEEALKETKQVDIVHQFLTQLRNLVADAKSKRPLAPEVTLLSLKYFQCARLLEISDKSRTTAAVNPTLLESGLKIFIEQPHIDFVYSAQHAQALRDVEGMIPMMQDEQITQFLQGTVDSIVDVLQRSGRLASAAKYVARVTSQLVNVTTAESNGQSAKMARLSYTLHVKTFGVEDPRTIFALYVLGLLSLTSAKTSKAAGTVGGLRKIIAKANTLPAPQQVLFYRTGNVYLLLEKAMAQLEAAGDVLAANSLKTHVGLLGRVHRAVQQLQNCGRGFMMRKRGKRGFLGAPAPMENLPPPLTLSPPSQLGEKLSPTGSFSFSAPASPHHHNEPSQLRLPQAIRPNNGSSPDQNTEVVAVSKSPEADSEEEAQQTFQRRPTFTHASAQGERKKQGGRRISIVGSLELDGDDGKEDLEGNGHHAASGEDHSESLFKLCDTDSDGLVTVDDCVSVFVTFNVMSQSDLKALFSNAARNASSGNGRLNFKEFSVVCAKAGL